MTKTRNYPIQTDQKNLRYSSEDPTFGCNVKGSPTLEFGGNTTLQATPLALQRERDTPGKNNKEKKTKNMAR